MSRQRLTLFILGFFALWTLAWLMHNALVGWGCWSTEDHSLELAYWGAAKFLVWVIYPWLYWRRRIPDLVTFIGLSRSTLRRGYQWGISAAVVWTVLSFAAMPLLHQHLVAVSSWSTYIYVLIFTPIFEEIFFRGFLLSAWQAVGLEGKLANVITSLLFLLIHILGWSFQHAVASNLLSTSWIGIFVLSMVAGFLRIHARSLRSPLLLHMANNALAGFLG